MVYGTVEHVHVLVAHGPELCTTWSMARSNMVQGPVTHGPTAQKDLELYQVLNHILPGHRQCGKGLWTMCYRDVDILPFREP